MMSARVATIPGMYCRGAAGEGRGGRRGRGDGRTVAGRWQAAACDTDRLLAKRFSGPQLGPDTLDQQLWPLVQCSQPTRGSHHLCPPASHTCEKAMCPGEQATASTQHHHPAPNKAPATDGPHCCPCSRLHERRRARANLSSSSGGGGGGKGGGGPPTTPPLTTSSAPLGTPPTPACSWLLREGEIGEKLRAQGQSGWAAQAGWPAIDQLRGRLRQCRLGD